MTRGKQRKGRARNKERRKSRKRSGQVKKNSPEHKGRRIKRGREG